MNAQGLPELLSGLLRCRWPSWRTCLEGNEYRRFPLGIHPRSLLVCSMNRSESKGCLSSECWPKLRRHGAEKSDRPAVVFSLALSRELASDAWLFLEVAVKILTDSSSIGISRARWFFDWLARIVMTRRSKSMSSNVNPINSSFRIPVDMNKRHTRHSHSGLTASSLWYSSRVRARRCLRRSSCRRSFTPRIGFDPINFQATALFMTERRVATSRLISARGDRRPLAFLPLSLGQSPLPIPDNVIRCDLTGRCWLHVMLELVEVALILARHPGRLLGPFQELLSNLLPRNVVI